MFVFIAEAMIVPRDRQPMRCKAERKIPYREVAEPEAVQTMDAIEVGVPSLLLALLPKKRPIKIMV
jgi:hypothetical protein